MDSRLVLPAGTVLDGDYRLLRVVGSGGFGITYEAEDINLGTVVAVKEYYPLDFGERGTSMSVVPRSERHKQTFERGRTSFLEEARTLARFEHPSIVRVTRVFEWNSNAYMVMRFERGMSLEAWLRSLGRPPAQEELDGIVAPLLDALERMHAINFLHRDIAPDNIIVRVDRTPVLLDFGAARRAIAEMSRSLTGVVKAGYSPHEQYSSDSRLQGPWSDLYALGATLYRAVTGKPPEESTLRVDEDQMASAATAAKGKYRRDFLGAIDACLKVRHSERPRSVAQVRPMLLGEGSQTAKATERLIEPTSAGAPAPPRPLQAEPRQATRRWPAIAATAAILAGAYGGYEYQHWNAGESKPAGAIETAAIDAEAKSKADALQRQAAVEAQRRQTEIEAERRRQEQVQAEMRRTEDAARRAALEEARRKDAADAEARRKEEGRVAALEEARRNEEKRKEDERLRLAAIPDDDKRAEFVRKIQLLLKRGGCYDGGPTGRSSDAQDGLDKFVESAKRRGKAKPVAIKLAKASVGDFESWLRDADEIKGVVCAPKPAPEAQEKAPRAREAQPSQAQAAVKKPGADSTRPGHGGSCPGWMFYNTSCVDAGGRTCRQTPGGRRCD